MNLRIGIQTRSLQLPLKQALHMAAQLGADGVEIDLRSELPVRELSQTGARQIRKLLSDLGLSVSAVGFPTRRGYDDPEDLERRILATQKAMQQAYQLGAAVVVNRVGQVPSETSDERYGRLVQSLSLLGAIGEKTGTRLAAQTTDSPDSLAGLLDALPPEAIGVDLHPSGLILNGHSPADAVKSLGKHILHAHATDAVRDLSLGRGVEVELGRGSADIPALLGSLEEFEYSGWVTVERQDSNDPITEIGNAVAYLKAL